MTLLRSVETRSTSNDRYRPLRSEAGLARVDGNLLAAPRPRLPQVGNSKAHRRQRSRAGLTDAERRGQYRIGVIGNLDFTGALHC